ncbi:hypothetical protein TWF481_005211 [Arthrobotrys musiformis]|uniref:Uncharacterized protein n=1 Tax=Arthrobotrys musiformis TaxID=47236 RepID=A0AAV9WEA0_9PEZI
METPMAGGPVATRLHLITKIRDLLGSFRGICDHIQLLRPELELITYQKYTKNWVPRIYNYDGEAQAITTGIALNDRNKLFEMMTQLGLSLWNVTKSDAYDYNPDGVVPKHANGETKAYILFILDYKTNSREVMIQEAARKDMEESKRREDRKRVKSVIRDRSQALARRGFRPLDDDTVEDAWEQEDYTQHLEYEGREGTKVFKELIRFGDYAPHRPVVVLRGTNYGFT